MWSMGIALNDAGLVRQIGCGTDRQAEAELFRRMAPRIRLYGLRHMGDEHVNQCMAPWAFVGCNHSNACGSPHPRQGRLAAQTLITYDMACCHSLWQQAADHAAASRS